MFVNKIVVWQWRNYAIWGFEKWKSSNNEPFEGNNYKQEVRIERELRGPTPFEDMIL